MKISVIFTDDDSMSLQNCTLNESYHSGFGALQESKHVFIKNGLNNFIDKKEINILEFGFGTGLNTLLALEFAKTNKIKISYISIEKYPVELKYIQRLNYDELVPKVGNKFIDLHKSEWEKEVKISEYFTLIKIENDFLETELPQNIDVVFYDAFSPDTQPELWTKELFSNIFNHMNSNSILTTYSSKGIVKQALRNSGFKVKRLEGPIGKHHILNAIKTDNQFQNK